MAVCAWVGLAWAALMPGRVCAQQAPSAEGAAGSGEPVATTTASEEASELDWMVLPALKYNSDAGFSYGARADLIRQRPNVSPFDWYVQLKLTHSTRSRHEHRLIVDVPRAFGIEPLRIRFRGDYNKINDALFFGVGNTTANVGPIERYEFELSEPIGRLLIRYDLGERVFVGGGAGFQLSAMTSAPETVLAQERPRGFDGGYHTEAIAFVGVDTRDHEIMPTRGHFTHLYLRGSVEGAGSTASFWSVGAASQVYVSPVPWLVLAQRGMWEDLSGDVPVYVMNRMGGWRAFRGTGGAFSQRGYLEGRFAGRTKLLSNTEARVYLPRFWKERALIGFGPFLDVSRVVDEGESLGDIARGGWHPSAGGELTFGWKKSFIVRLDYGVSDEDQLFYIQGRHLF